MTLLYQSPAFLEHETGSHPEQPERLRQIAERLAETGLDTRCTRPEWHAVSPARLARVHSPDYVQSVADFAARGGGNINADTVVSPRSYDVALLAAGAVCDAVERVVRGEDTRALALVRPPGHHALAQGAMGFCLFSNVSIAARLAIDELDLERVLIVDWDVHHGNGTQDAFWESSQVGFFSVHRWPFYPGTGSAEETGTGTGLGFTQNLPVEMGTSRRDYLSRVSRELEAFAAKVKPQLVLLSAGFDSHREDPVGSLGLETEDFLPLTQVVLDASDAYAEGRLVSVLEGGYNPLRLAESVEIHLRTLLDRQQE